MCVFGGGSVSPGIIMSLCHLASDSREFLLLREEERKKKTKDLFSGKRDITWYIPNLIK